MGAPSWVSKYVGLPYSLHGRTPSGVDCYGLCLLVWANEFGFHGLGDPPYQSVKDKVLALEKGLSDWEKVEDPRVGDAVLFHCAGRPLHIGMVVEKGWMLHIEADSMAGRPKYSSYERYLTPLWRSRVLGFYRYAK